MDRAEHVQTAAFSTFCCRSISLRIRHISFPTGSANRFVFLSLLSHIKELRSAPGGVALLYSNLSFKSLIRPTDTGALDPHLSHSSSSSSLPVSPPVVYSVSYWDSSSSGLRLRLLPLLAEGLRVPPPVSSEGLELVPPAWETTSDGRLVVLSEYLQPQRRRG